MDSILKEGRLIKLRLPQNSYYYSPHHDLHFISINHYLRYLQLPHNEDDEIGSLLEVYRKKLCPPLKCVAGWKVDDLATFLIMLDRKNYEIRLMFIK